MSKVYLLIGDSIHREEVQNMDEPDVDTVDQEFLVVPVKQSRPSRSQDKLMMGNAKVLQFELDGPMTDEILNEAIVRRFGRPTSTTKYLAVPLDNANIATVKPTVETKNELFTSYAKL